MNKKLDFKDINLVPKMCIVSSRDECDTSLIFGGHKFKLPVVPANMVSIINIDIAEKLASNGYFYILHRFNIDVIDFLKDFKSKNLITSISLGVNDDAYLLIEKMLEFNLIPDFITIDIAHGHALKMKMMLEYLKENLPNTFIIAGNVCTREAVADLEQWGADCIKVGIAPGNVCVTAYVSGYGSRGCMASTILDLTKTSKVPLIADGGLEYPGDISKALTLGATMTMCGNLLSACTDSPGELVTNENGVVCKEYFGSASEFQDGKFNRIEGTKKLIVCKNKSFLEQLTYLKECVQSSISYGGGNSLEAFKTVRYI